MKFQLPVQEGQFIKRYKRFFADIDRQGEVITAHVPNTGSMRGCLDKNSKVRFTVSDDPKRKLKYTLQMIKTPSSWVGINTHLANGLVKEAWENQKIPHWKSYKFGQGEIKINDKSRIDWVMWKKNLELDKKGRLLPEHIQQEQLHFVEVKNVTMAQNNVALFPDAVTTRGQKHIEELMALMEKGHTCELFFVVQRTDCKEFQPAKEIDPKYAELLKTAKKKGLAISAYPSLLKKDKIELDTRQPLQVKL